jgi:selenide,water dikinase
VDDPYLFGQVAAANALSDVYAMGGRPVAALNLVGFPSDKLPLEMLQQIMAGALSKVHEAGAVLAGGHSTEDEEPKFGLSVTGVVHPTKVWRNVGARPGDRLVLTKPIGSGVLFNANRKGWVSPRALEDCLATITTLNAQAAEILGRFPVHACTDVTGFGLAGHAFNMAKGSGVTLVFDLDALPVMSEALAMYKRGVRTGVNLANRSVVHGHLRFERELPAWHEEIVFDPQTSGGLLAAVPGEQAEDVLADLHAAGVRQARLVGEARTQGSVCLVFR